MKNRITTAFLIALLAAGSHAVAQSKLSRQYDLDTQEAITGLQSLALQGGFQVFFPSEIVKGKTIRAVRDRALRPKLDQLKVDLLAENQRKDDEVLAASRRIREGK